MEDLHNVGGTPAVLKYLAAQNLIDVTTKTCTTHTLEKNLSQCPELKQGQHVVLQVDKPMKKSGHIQILYGNLAPDGAVAKITGREGESFEGEAIVFDSALLPHSCLCSMCCAFLLCQKLLVLLWLRCRSGVPDVCPFQAISALA